jgi:hypothetical protein
MLQFEVVVSELDVDFDALITEIHRILGHPPLSDIQFRVLRQAWQGRTYAEISAHEGYEESYLRDVGSKLWKRFSDALGERVTKTNLQVSLQRHLSLRQPPSQPILSVESSPVRSRQFEPVTAAVPEYPSGPVPLSSRFYIERPPIEQSAYVEVTKPGALIRIKGPRGTGKNSLLLRILSHASTLQYRTVWLDFQQADDGVFASMENLLRWFAALISHRLGLEPCLDDYWDDRIGSKMSCTLYLQQYLLRHSDRPLVLALNELNRIFEYPPIAHEFLLLLRSWHEEAKQSESLQKLRLVIVHATEIYVRLAIQQSPFNVGLAVSLPDFNQSQVEILAERHNISGLNRSAIEQLMWLLGGHPQLVRLSLYHLAQGSLSVEQLMDQAVLADGIYYDHLTERFDPLRHNTQLAAVVSQIIATDGNVYVSEWDAFQLERLGIVRRRGDRLVMRNQLYQIYCCSQLFNFVDMQQSILASAQPQFALGQRVKLQDGRFAYIVGLAIDPTRQTWEYCTLPILDVDDFDEMIWCEASEISAVDGLSQL